MRFGKLMPWLFAALSLLGGTNLAAAATFSCIEEADKHDIENYGLPIDRAYCRRLSINGEIVDGDITSLQQWLTREPYVTSIKIASPGGAVDAAINVGRLIRKKFISVDTFDLQPNPASVCADSEDYKSCLRQTDCRIDNRCCMSACVLVVFSGAFRDALNLGLHRPSLKDTGETSYDDSHRAISSGNQRVKRFLEEMEAPPAVYEAMMKVPPDEIQLLDWEMATALISGVRGDSDAMEQAYRAASFSYPPSIYD